MSVPRLTVTQRTRHTLNRLLRQPGYSKTALASYCHKPGSWLSAFLHPDPKRSANPSFHLDELDDIAAYFRISLSELLGAPKAGDLSGDESRVLYAFRALSPALQEHFVAILETTASAPRISMQKVLPRGDKAAITEAGTPSSTSVGAAHGRTLPTPHAADPAAKLAIVLAAVNRALVDLGAATADQGDPQSDAAADAGQAAHRDVAR